MTTPQSQCAAAGWLMLLAVALAGFSLSIGNTSAGDMKSVKHNPDHFVVGISDLEKGMSRVEELTGVRPVHGGRHPRIGTRNALISLGEHSYLEIIAPDPAADSALLDPALKARFMEPLKGMDSLTPFLWAVGSSDLESTAGLLRAEGIVLSPPAPGARKKPDGSLLEWRASFITEPRLDGLPFFIEWLDPTKAPPKNSPGGCRLHRFEISGPETATVQRVAERLSLTVGISEEPEQALRIELDCPQGRVVF